MKIRMGTEQRYDRDLQSQRLVFWKILKKADVLLTRLERPILLSDLNKMQHIQIKIDIQNLRKYQ